MFYPTRVGVPRDPRVLRPLRGDRRIHGGKLTFGFRHVHLEAASVESSGVQWSTANYVELALNFNKPKPFKITAGSLENGLGRPPGRHLLSPSLYNLLLLKFKISSKRQDGPKDISNRNLRPN